MRRVFKTRHFHRWLRKTELSDAALCSAISEMANGLIDADLGGGILKKESVLRAGANAVAPERWSPPTKAVSGFSSTDSKKMKNPTLLPMNWALCKILQRNCSP